MELGVESVFQHIVNSTNMYGKQVESEVIRCSDLNPGADKL